MSDHNEFVALLRRTGVITGSAPRLTPLSGGVSSEIYRVEDDGRTFVLKRALARLRVAEPWFADVSRNRAEQAFLRHVATFLPAAVPRVLDCHPEHGFFTMEYLGEGFVNWKQLLLAGETRGFHARRAGQVLGEIHHRSFRQTMVAGEFNPVENFRQLRLDPYLLRTADRHPDLAAHLRVEADRLAATCECLVHGDYSPKNILLSDDRLVVLDCEVACFSDAVFDTAFLLNHFFLKSLHHHPTPCDLAGLVTAFWQAYLEARVEDDDPTLEMRTVRLLPMLMLARVDGKSPAEYLTQPAKQQFVREFTRGEIGGATATLESLTRRWLSALTRLVVSVSPA
ncbi:MAG: aminoglycoside phosphotransferase family protein [Verrucomicrobiales bacterium]|nr:aminoglycoside phosphotransferase family protein [Verrucomicrobiales bacterium]